MAVVSALSPVSLSSYFDPTTGTALQVNLYFYRANTLDPIPVYADALLSVLHPVPLLSTGYGRVPPVFVGEMESGYRVRVFNQYSELIEDIDDLPGAIVAGGGGGGGGTIEPGDPHLLATGDYIFSSSGPIPRAGAVLANGATIGSAGSTATGRANDDTEALFKLLWGADNYGLLPVLPSRGASASGDWLANKQITLPDLQCRILLGMDAMGAAATGRFAGVPMASGADLPARMFAKGGTKEETLTLLQVPTHAHALTVAPHSHGATVPAHAHTVTGSTTTNGDHAHTASASTEGAHAHVYQIGGNIGAGNGGGPAPVLSSLGDAATSTAGAHTHNIVVNAAGNHAHTVAGNTSTTGAQALTTTSITVGVTMDSQGGGGAHNNVQPFITSSVYLVL